MSDIKNLTISTDVSELPLVGASITKALQSIGVFNIADLLYNFPTRYMDYRKKVNIAAATEGETITVAGRVKSVKANLGFRSRMAFSEITVEDGTGKIKAVWFNQTYIAKSLNVGDEIILSGKISFYKTLQFTNPAYELMKSEDEAVGTSSGTSEYLHTGRLVPVYRKSDVVPLRTMRKLVKLCLPLADQLEDFVADEFKSGKDFELTSIKKAIEFLHFPETEEQVMEGRLRIAVDDILPQQIAVEMQKAAKEKALGYKIKVDIEKVKLFLGTLPFELTPSQKRAVWDIFQDIESGKPMNRLLQGDVGSGKTMVAILAALQTAGSGYQTAILAPTEILAKQHYETMLAIFGTPKKTKKTNSTGGIALVTRTFSLIDGDEVSKPEMTKKIEAGQVQVCIGTHALLQGKINFKNLALLVIDEQHRFGVAQRSFLMDDGVPQKSKTSTHLLSMSATPIPRTLAMSMYGDLQVSTLTHLPNKKSVGTFVVSEENREQAYDYIREEVKNGHQAFIVTPRVEESAVNSEATSEVRSVKKEFLRLQDEVFPNLRLGLLYGKMKGAEKDKVMSDFAAGNVDILVSTSVIEIGIDIPNATAMIIEGSERFGLAQLHQLRGRIGRNNLTNKCFLFTTEASQQDTKRLTALAKSNDGFALAELDLEERGFGDLFGKQQSGFAFRFPQFISLKALKIANQIGQTIYKQDSKLKTSPELKKLSEAYLIDLHGE